MIKYTLTVIITFIYSLANAQNNDVTIDANKKEIISAHDTFKSDNIESLTNYFYGNIGNVKKIDKIISYKFYQATPYYEFKNLMSAKETRYGNFIKKEILKIDYSNNKKKVTVSLKVKYTNIESKEQLVFIKESEKEGYNIVEYKIE